MIACISKDYLKTLLSVDNSRPISTPTFIKLYKKHKLHEVAGLSEREFKNAKVFCKIEATKILTYFKFEKEELL